MPQSENVHDRLYADKRNTRGRSRSPHERPKSSTRRTSSVARSPKSKSRKSAKSRLNYKNPNELDTPSYDNTKEQATSNSRRYAPPSKTYGEMSKELKKHQWNEKNLVKIKDKLENKNEKLVKDLETERKISGDKDDQINNLKIRNSDLDKKVADYRLEIDRLQDEKYEDARKFRALKNKSYEYIEMINEMDEQLKICKNKLDKRGDKKSRNYRLERDSDSDWQ